MYSHLRCLLRDLAFRSVYWYHHGVRLPGMNLVCFLQIIVGIVIYLYAAKNVKRNELCEYL